MCAFHAVQRMEDSIIFSLIERSQYKMNAKVYEPDCEELGAFKLHTLKAAGSNGCLGDYFIYQTECLHSQVRRYNHPTEYPFFGPLPEVRAPARLWPAPPLHACVLYTESRARGVWCDLYASRRWARPRAGAPTPANHRSSPLSRPVRLSMADCWSSTARGCSQRFVKTATMGTMAPQLSRMCSACRLSRRVSTTASSSRSRSSVRRRRRRQL